MQQTQVKLGSHVTTSLHRGAHSKGHTLLEHVLNDYTCSTPVLWLILAEEDAEA